MPIEFTFIGEHRDDTGQLLVQGADGAYYAYDLVRGLVNPTELDERWMVLAAPADRTL